MKRFKQITSLVLSLVLIVSLLPVTTLANGDPFTITVTENNTSSATLSTGNNYVTYRSWSATVSQFEGTFTGTIYTQTMSFDSSLTVTYCETTSTTGFELSQTGKNTNEGTQNSTAYATITVTDKTAAEIQTYLNSNLYMKAEGTTEFGSGKYWPGLNDYNATLLAINGTVNNASIVGHTVTVVKGGGNETANADNDGTGTIKVNDREYTFGQSLTVNPGAEVKVEIFADSSSYIAAYSVTGSDDILDIDIDIDDEPDLELRSKEITVTANGDITISVLFLKKVELTVPDQPSVPSDDDQRTQGALVWSKDIGTTISYKEAVGGLNFNARVNTYLLNSYFGTSIYYGQNPLPDPSVYMYLTMEPAGGGASTTITAGNVDMSDTLDRDTIGGKKPSKNGIDLAVNLEKNKIVPGTVTQAVFANYTTAGSICVNHWYHVYGVKTWKSKLERTFTIEKDVLGFYNNGTALANGATFTFNQNGEVEGFNPQLLPASYNEAATQAMTGYTSQTAYTIYDAEGNPVPNNKITKAGTYTIKNNAFTATSIIKGYDAGEVAITFTVNKGTNPTTVVAPVIESVTATSIKLDPSSIVDGQKYQFTSGGTVYTGAELKAMGYVISGLTENTSYTLATELPATDMYNAQQVAAAAVTTYIKVAGSIQVDEASAPLLAEGTKVTFTAGGKEYTAIVDANGNYSIDLPAGTYSVSAESADGTQKGALASYTVANDTPDAPETVPAITMKDTPAGVAKKQANQFMTDKLSDGNGFITTATAANYQKILDSKAAYDQLSTDAKAAVDALLAPTTYAQLLEAAKAEELKAAKSAAEAAINKAAKEQKDEIDKLDYLTPERKAELKAAIDAEAAEAKANIAAAADTTAVTKAQNDGAAAMEGIVDNAEKENLANAKAAAKEAINEAAEAKKAQIDALKNLSAQRKAQLKAAIDAEAAEAINKVNASNDPTAVENAWDAGIDAMDDIVEDAVAEDLAIAKSKAEAAINEAAEAKKDEIDKLDYLTPERKAQLKAQIDAEAEKAINRVNSATNTTAVSKAKSDGVSAINRIAADAVAEDLANAKAEAEAAINDAAADKKAQIDALVYLSAEKKAEMKAAIDAEAAEAITNITAATDTTAVEKARDEGIAAIEKIAADAVAEDAALLKAAQDAAVAELDKKAESMKQEIEALENLTAEQKAAALKALEEAHKAAVAAVKEQTTVEQVEKAKEAGLAAIAKIGAEAALQDAKNDAIAQLDKMAESVKQEIEALENLSAEQKAAALKALEEAHQAAVAAVKEQTTIEQVEKAKEAGLAAIAKIGDSAAATDLEAGKAAASGTVGQVATDAKAAIEALEHLTDEEKAAFLASLDALVQAAEAALKDAKDTDAAAAIAKQAAEEIGKLLDQAVAQDFLNVYVTGADGKIYAGLTSENVDQITSGREPWAALSAEQKALVDAAIADANKALEGAPQGYEDFLAAAEAFAEASAQDFIKEHLTAADGSIFLDATKDNYKQILSAVTDWDTMSQAEKDAVDEKLLAAGGKTYEQLFALAKAFRDAEPPATGDNSPVVLWGLTILISSLAVLVLCYKKKPTAR